MNINKFSILSFALFLQMVSMNANASDISGITPIPSGNSNIYNINPAFSNKANGTGFRKYEKFNLTKGDNANFIMNDISQFVNLVDSKVSIEGLVNTVKSDFSKSNGNLIFVTPEGFVVGANGVLNVGSLSVYTPTQEGYNTLSNQLSGAAGTNQTVNFDPATLSIGNGLITIDGKIIANGNINFNAKSIQIGKDGHVISGLSADNTFISFDKETGNIEITDAENLFNTLVNSGKLNSNKTEINYNTNGGNIELGGLTENKNGNININIQNGNLLNGGISDTLLKSTDDININAKNGSVGEIPTNRDDFSKSVNIQSDGKVNIYADNIVNVASLDKDLYVDNITGDTVYLTIDKTTENGTNPNLYSANKTTPNIVGNKISISTAGNIGKTNERITVSSNSNSQVFDDNSWNNNKFKYTPKGDGIEVVSKFGNIHLKDNDNSANFKNVSAENGKVEAQFKGNTYIENLSGANVNILTQGDVLYIENFQSDTILDDTTNKFTALGLGSDNTKLSDSTIIIKNGTIGTNEKATTLAFSADNIYADGKHFVLGKDRSETPLDNTTGDKTYIVGNAKSEEDSNTSKINVMGDNNVNITANAVTENDVQNAEDVDGLTRVYYQSSDGIDEISYTINSTNNESNIIFFDGDEPEFGGDTDDDSDIDNPDIGDNDTDPDLDGDGDTDSDSDNDTKEPDLGDSDNDNDSDNPNIGDTDSDDDIDNPDIGDSDDDNDTDKPSEPDTGDSDSDDDTDIPVGDTDSDDDIDKPSTGDTDDDDDSDIPPTTGDSDSDNDPDIPIGDTDSDDDIDNPSTGDTDDDDDSDIPPTTGDSDSDDDPDIPIGDTDSDDDIDNPSTGDTDDDDDSDIPPDPSEPDIGDTDTDDDNDNKPPHGDTDDDSDSDLPPINPKPPVTPDMSDLQPIINNNTEPPKPLHLVTDVLVVPTNDDENDYSVERAVNTNGLFGDTEQRADQILAPIRRDAAKKRKFDFRWWFK